MDHNTLTPEDIKFIKKHLKTCKHFWLIEILLRGRYPISIDTALTEIKNLHPSWSMVELVNMIHAINSKLKQVGVIMRRDVGTGLIWFAKHERQLQLELW